MAPWSGRPRKFATAITTTTPSPTSTTATAELGSRGSQIETDRGQPDAMTTPSYSTDQDNIVRYVPGDMAIDEQIELEVRMAGDQDLEQAVVTVIAIDDLLRRAAEEDRRGRP